MGPLVIRRLMRRRRHHAIAALAMMLVAAAVALHHSDLAAGDMGGMHHDGGATMVEMCLGTFAAVSAAVVAVAFGLFALGRWPWLRPTMPHVWSTIVRAPAPRARAGPDLLRLVCVWRC